MKLKIISIIIFLVVANNSDGQRFKIECNEFDFDSNLVLNYILSDKSLELVHRKSYQSRRRSNSISQPITVKFFNGVKPYINQWGPYEETGIEADQNNIYSRTPGIYNLRVIDSIGARDSCYIKFYMPETIDLTICSKSEIVLKEYIDYFDTDEFIISYQLENIEYTIDSIDQLPPLPVDMESIELKYLNPTTLNEVHSMRININNLRPGDKCDDKDECTYDDIVRENCICEGTHIIDSLEIKVDYSAACFNDNVTLSTKANNYEQYWRGKYVSEYGNSVKVRVKEPTYINLYLKDKEGCELFQQQRIIPKRLLEIKTDSDFFCNDEDVILKIDDTENFKSIVWFDEFHNTLDSVNKHINIQRPGKYFVHGKTDNCYKSGEVEIKSTSYVDYKIKIENNYLCDKSETLVITPPLDQSYNQSVIWKFLTKNDFENNSSNWKVIQEDIDSIDISQIGLYALEVIEENPFHDHACKSYDQVVVYNNESHKLLRHYISYQLKYHEWKFKFIEQTSTPFKWNSNQYISVNTIEGNSNKNEIILESIEDQRRFVLQEQFLKRLNRLAEYSSKIKGHLISLDCGKQKSIDRYLKNIDGDSFPFVCLYHIDRSSEDPNDWMIYVYTKGEFGDFRKLID